MKTDRPARPQTPDPLPNARAYRHRKCGGTTFVGDSDYVDICNPLVFCRATMCMTCAAGVPLESVAWTDTNETLADYRRRMGREHTPLWLKAGKWVVAPLILLAGVWLVYQHQLRGGRPLWTSLAVIVALLFWHVGVPRLLPKLAGLDYRRFR